MADFTFSKNFASWSQFPGWGQMPVLPPLRTPMTVAYLGYRVWQLWHVPWAPLRRGRKNCFAKIKLFVYSFLNLYFAPHTFVNCKARSQSRACCARTTKHYDKAVVLCLNTTVTHWDRTRTLTCHIYETSSFSRYKKR